IEQKALVERSARSLRRAARVSTFDGKTKMRLASRPAPPCCAPVPVPPPCIAITVRAAAPPFTTVQNAVSFRLPQFPELGPLFLALGIGYVFSTRPAAVKVLMNQRSLSARGVATLANGHSVLVRVGMEEDARLSPVFDVLRCRRPDLTAD